MLAVFPDAFPDACRVSGCDSGNNLWIPLCYIASGGSLEKNTFSGFRFAILPPAGQRSQKKHVPGKQTRIYSIYI